MTLDFYHDAWEQDAPISPDNLDADARAVPYLHAKWWRFYTSERLAYKKLSIEFKLLYRQKWEWFTGKLHDDERNELGWPVQNLRVLSTNAQTYIDADPDIQTQQKRIALAEETLRFLEDVIKSINARNYSIKNAIDFLRFKMGN